jgi:hypothetical protein
MAGVGALFWITIFDVRTQASNAKWIAATDPVRIAMDNCTVLPTQTMSQA